MNSSPIRTAPTRPIEILKQLGPGLIIAASIVGSGELIATTLTGAKAGISLLWLIVLGCVIKVFAQIEIGRFTITTGTPTLSAMAMVPGPRIQGRGNWLVWYWFFMWFCSIAQLGGIAGACGQVLALAIPLTQQGQSYNEIRGSEIRTQINSATGKEVVAPGLSAEDLAIAKNAYVAKFPVEVAGNSTGNNVGNSSKDRPVETTSSSTAPIKKPWDDRLWAVPIAVITAIMLVIGKYGMIQTVATILVATFTFITMGNVLRLQMLPDWHITSAEILYGLSFHLPQADDWKSSLLMALAVVGVIGVGAAELVQYPYWCLEKGYAKWTGSDDGSEEWVTRAKGWLRVMKADAWVSMVVYTVATICFFLLGVAILHRTGIVPQESTLLQTLSLMYEPVLSSWAPIIFILGAFAVLYSTFYVANASHARTFTDGLCVMGLIPATETSIQRSIKVLCGLFPFLCLAVYWVVPEPGSLVFLSGAAQAIMLPMMCAAAIFFRYYKCHPRLRPSIWSDIGLWMSSAVMTIVGVYSLVNETIRLVSRWISVLLLVTSCSLLLSAVGCTDASSTKSTSESASNLNESSTAGTSLSGTTASGSPLTVSSVPLRIRADLPQEVLDVIARRWKSHSEQPVDLQPMKTYDLLSGSTKSDSGTSKSKPQADIFLIESRWLATFADLRWVRPLPTSLLESVPNIAHWRRVATYGQRLWGVPLGTNFLAFIEPSKKNESIVSAPDSPKLIAQDDSPESIDWIVDRFLLSAAADNPSPSDSSFLFKPIGAKSRLNEAWLVEVAIKFAEVSKKESSEANLFSSAEVAWEGTRQGAFKQAHGWPAANNSLIESKMASENKSLSPNQQDFVVTAPQTWTDSGRTLLLVLSQTNRQSAASERFINWLNDDLQRQALAEVTSRIKPLPENQHKVTARPDRDSYHRLIASAMNERYVSVELQFAGAKPYRNALGKALSKMVRQELSPQEALQECHIQWEALSNQIGRDQLQRSLYLSLDLAKWE